MAALRFVILIDDFNRPSQDDYLIAIEKPDLPALLLAADNWSGLNRNLAKRRYVAKRLQSVTVRRDGAEFPGAAYVLMS